MNLDEFEAYFYQKIEQNMLKYIQNRQKMVDNLMSIWMYSKFTEGKIIC